MLILSIYNPQCFWLQIIQFAFKASHDILNWFHDPLTSHGPQFVKQYIRGILKSIWVIFPSCPSEILIQAVLSGGISFLFPIPPFSCQCYCFQSWLHIRVTCLKNAQPSVPLIWWNWSLWGPDFPVILRHSQGLKRPGLTPRSVFKFIWNIPSRNQETASLSPLPPFLSKHTHTLPSPISVAPTTCYCAWGSVCLPLCDWLEGTDCVTSYPCKPMVLSTQKLVRKYLLPEPVRKVQSWSQFTDKETHPEGYINEPVLYSKKW